MIKEIKSYLLIVVVMLIVSCDKKNSKTQELFDRGKTYILSDAEDVVNDYSPLEYTYYIEFPPNSLPFPGSISVLKANNYVSSYNPQGILSGFPDELLSKYYRDSYTYYYFGSEIQELDMPAKMTLTYQTMEKYTESGDLYKVLNNNAVRVYKIENKGTDRINSILDISNWQEIPYLSNDSDLTTTWSVWGVNNRIIFELTDLTATYVLAHEFE